MFSCIMDNLEEIVFPILVSWCGHEGHVPLNKQEQAYTTLKVSCSQRSRWDWLIVNLLTFSSGAAYSWTSSVLPIIRSKDNENNPLSRPITVNEQAWIVGLMSLGCFIGIFIASQLSLKFGKKKTLVISAVPIIISNFLSAFATDVGYYFAARLLAGISSGSCTTLIPLYVGEITNKLSRGTYGCFFGLFLKLGTVISLIIGPYCSVKTLSLITAVPPIVFLIIFPIVFPETPYHTISCGEKSQGEKILRKFRSSYNNEDIKKELIEIYDYLENKHHHQSVLKTILQNKASRRSLVIACGISCFQHLSGIIVIISYVQTILEESNIPLGSDVASSIAGVVQLIIAIGASLIVDKYGRRSLLIISGSLMMLALIMLGTFFFLKHGFDIGVLNWVPLFAVILYFAGFSIGFGPVGFVMLGELFEKDVKIPVASVATACGTLASFLVTFTFPFITDAVGIHYSFWILASFALMSTIFVILFVPETSKKSFTEIQENLSKHVIQVSSCFRKKS